jgi:hypothetical protein
MKNILHITAQDLQAPVAEPQSIDPELQAMYDEAIRRLDEIENKRNAPYERAKQISDKVHANPDPDEPETYTARLELDAKFDPVSAEAVRILKSMTPQDQEEWFNAFNDIGDPENPRPSEWNSLKIEELEQKVSLPEKKKLECMMAITRALGELPQFSDRVKAEEEPAEEEAEIEVEPIEVVGKTLKTKLTKQTWEAAGKKQGWL